MPEPSATEITSRGSAATFLDAAAERAAAEEAEKKEDCEAALLHYENIYDSTKTDEAARTELRGKFEELLPKVAPNTDKSKAGRWKLRAYVFRPLDVSWTDEDGKEHRAQHRFRDDEIETIRNAIDEFAGLVWKHSWGSLKIEWEMKIIEEPLMGFDGVPGPQDCMPHFTDLKTGEVDNLFVFAKSKADREKDEQTSEDIPSKLLAGILPVLPNTKGAIYIAFNMFDSSHIMLHEYMHAVGCALDGHQGYPQGLMANPDNVTDCFHLLERYATRKMLRELSITERASNPWVDQYSRDFLVAGPFSVDGAPGCGLDIPFVEEPSVKPSAGDKAGEHVWRPESALGHVLDFCRLFEVVDNRLAYAAVTVRSAKDQFAQLRIGAGDAYKVWQDGEVILCAPVEGGAAPDRNIVGVRLKEGPNLFLVKVGNKAGNWGLIFRISDGYGNPLPDVEYVVPGSPPRL